LPVRVWLILPGCTCPFIICVCSVAPGECSTVTAARPSLSVRVLGPVNSNHYSGNEVEFAVRPFFLPPKITRNRYRVAKRGCDPRATMTDLAEDHINVIKLVKLALIAHRLAQLAHVRRFTSSSRCTLVFFSIWQATTSYPSIRSPGIVACLIVYFPSLCESFFLPAE